MTRDLLIRALQCDLRELASTPLAPVDVAILDSGIDATHPDLMGHVDRAFGVELDGDGPKLTETTPGENDVFGHGTAVASVILSIAPNARLIDIRVLGASNTGAGLALIAGLAHAVQLQSRVINMSLAATASFSDRLSPLCEKAYYQNQVVVASMRNMPLQDRGFPAELSSCIGVGKRKSDDPFAYDYIPADAIEYAAWGVDVPVACPGGGYSTISGTSYATPRISGICALLLGAFPDLMPFEIKTLLRAHASVR